MARTFASGDKVRTNVGGCNVNAGGITLAMLTKLDASRDGTWRALMCGVTSGGAASGFSLELDPSNRIEMGNGALSDNASTDPATTAASGYVIVAGTKASGNVHPRIHRYSYSGNSWFHAAGNSTNVTDGTAPGSSGFVELGGDLAGAGDTFVGDIALAAVWNRVLSDAEMELLPYTLQAWYASVPVGLWLLDQGVTTQKILDLVGGGANESSLTGTSVASAAVPLFNYSDGIWLPTHTAASGGGTPAIVPAAINATSSMSASVVKLAAVKPAAVNATSTVTATVTALKRVTPAAINSTSTIAGSLVFLRAITPAAINATSPITATVTGGSSGYTPRMALLGVG